MARRERFRIDGLSNLKPGEDRWRLVDDNNFIV